LSSGKKLALALGAIATLATPIVFGLVSLPLVRAQLLHANGPLPSFEVVSIKPSQPDSRNESVGVRAGSFVAENAPLKDIVEFAYNIASDDELPGAPAWIGVEKYDIDTKEDEATLQRLKPLPLYEQMDQVRLMVQSLLAERFQLRVSTQTKEMPVYALIVAKGGPKLKTVPVQPSDSNDGKPAGPHFTGVKMGKGLAVANYAPISLLVGLLSRQPELGGRTVLDETGLKGNFDWNLKWQPQNLAGISGGPAGAPPGADAAPPDTAGPSLFTALEEQLGLKLTSTKGPVEVLVIDHVEKPSPN
jgi:uncharacterized protein (TIGR03435 family)